MPVMSISPAGFSADAEANVMMELAFKASRPYAEPFSDLTLDVVFTEPGGRELRVPAFWAGGDAWKVRYASPLIGEHTFRTEATGEDDGDLHDLRGQVAVRPYTGTNPLYRHGPIRVSENKRYLEHLDATPFFWLGDTWWMGLAQRLHFPEEFAQMAADRVKKGFNVIQIVAGLYPDMPAYDPRGANEAGFPYEKDYARIRPEYYDAVDRRLMFLVEQGLMPCLVGAWGYFIKWMGVEKMKAHWRYLIARYGALPVTWCVAGEANLPFYQVEGFPFDDREQVKDWTKVMAYVREINAFGRLMTIHPTGLGRLSSRNAVDDWSLLDFDLLQTPHAQREAVAPTVTTVRETYADTPTMPVINGEAAYEMLSDSLPTEWTRRMFWICMMNGAAGHTYGANGIWQNNRPGDPHGNSPTGSSYGKITREEAMNLPGSTQMSLGKKLFLEYSWQKFEPHPEWARFADTEPGDVYGPQSCGIADVVRLIYVPESKEITCLDLGANQPFGATYFDPVTGETSEIGRAVSSDDGSWVCPPKARCDHDWVLILRI